VEGQNRGIDLSFQAKGSTSCFTVGDQTSIFLEPSAASEKLKTSILDPGKIWGELFNKNKLTKTNAELTFMMP
jgi:hypothetical protein